MTAGLFDFDGLGDGDRACGDPDVAGAVSDLWTHLGGGPPNCATAFGVFGSFGAVWNGTGQQSERRFCNGYTTDHLFVGFHTLIPGAIPSGRIDLYEGTTRHLTIEHDLAALAIVVRNNAGTLLLSSGPGTVPVNAWIHCVVEAVLHESAGELRIYIGGVPDPTAEVTGIDTMNGGTGVLDRLRFAGGTTAGASGAWYLDDLYLIDGNVVGAVTLGGARVTCRVPVSDSTAQLTPSTGASNFALVDERPFDSADYNETDVDAEKDLYGISDDALAEQIFGVRAIGQMSKSDAGAAQMRLIIDDGTQGNGATRLLSATPTVYYDIFPTPPSGGTWDEATVDALLIGAERVAL